MGREKFVVESGTVTEKMGEVERDGTAQRKCSHNYCCIQSFVE